MRKNKLQCNKEKGKIYSEFAYQAVGSTNDNA